MAEIGVGMLGYAFMGKAHSNAFHKLAYMTSPPPLVPKLVGIAACSTACALRPAMPTSFGTSGGGHVMYASLRNAFECALPMNA